MTGPNMNPDRVQGELKRAGYLGVFNIENVVIDETGINFDFAGAYARRRKPPRKRHYESKGLRSAIRGLP